MNNQIEQALNQNADLSAAEYKEKTMRADEITKAHGETGNAPVSEALRHKRVQTNYYAPSLNVSLALLAAIDRNNDLLAELINEVKNGKLNKS